MDHKAKHTVYFYAQTDAFSEFSNVAPYGVAFDGLWWRTVEHYFQAMKFSDRTYRERIRACTKPKDAKALGMTRALPLRPDWETVKDGIMLEACAANSEPMITQDSFFCRPAMRRLPKMPR
jgi:ribA/ribD-fused uncharacterized protein